MRALQRRHVELADHRIAQVLRSRLPRPGQKLFPIDDLQHAALVGAIAEIDTVAARAGRDHAVQLGGHGAARPRLLARETVFANLYRLGGVAEIVALGHAARAPARHAGNKVGNSGVAFPPALVRVLEIPAYARDQARALRPGHVPYLVTLPAEGTQKIGLA